VGHQREQDGVAPGADAHRIRRPAVGRDLALERFDLGAEDEVLRLDDTRDGGVDLPPQCLVLRA
jgi:hypothetical protein